MSLGIGLRCCLPWSFKFALITDVRLDKKKHHSRNAETLVSKTMESRTKVELCEVEGSQQKSRLNHEERVELPKVTLIEPGNDNEGKRKGRRIGVVIVVDEGEQKQPISAR